MSEVGKKNLEHKEDAWMAMKYMKRCSTFLVIREWKLKSQWDAIAYPPEWLKF